MTVQNRSAVRRFFRPDGLLSTKHPAFEPRRGQLDMAVAVEEALLEKRKLIVEAGTGTGKTLAYLVPALLSERRVVVSTGTKALQEQLFFRDIPFLEQRPANSAQPTSRDSGEHHARRNPFHPCRL